MLRAHGVTEKGRIRPTNEDCFRIIPDLQLCVVADGMGGHKAGEIASRMAVDAIADYISTSWVTTTWPFGFEPSLSESGNLLRTAVQVANLRIVEAAAASHQFAGMGTTIVAALVRNGRLSVAHVGDSRLYLRTRTGIRQLTDDDSWMASVLARDPGFDPTLLQSHPMRHALTRVVGAKARTDVHVSEELLVPGDVLALTTDGVHGVLDEERILEVVAGSGGVNDIAPGLVRAALARGSRDNLTAVAAEYLG